jgi:hypothetical protein
MIREYECAACGKKNDGAPGEPLAMQECRRGCGELFCAQCLPEHEAACAQAAEAPAASVPDATGYSGDFCSLDFDEHLGG